MAGEVPPVERRSQRRVLGTAFSAIEQVADPFKRLAWLVDRHVELTGKEPSDCLTRFDLPGDGAYDTEARIRNYYELCCKPLFPRELIWFMNPQFRRQFLDVLDEENKLPGDVYDNYKSDEDVISAIVHWLNFSESLEPRSGVQRVIEDSQKTLIEVQDLRDPSEVYHVQGAVTQAFTESERLLRQMASFYGRFLFGPDYVERFLERFAGERETCTEEDWERLLPQLERQYEVLNDLAEEERAQAIRGFAEFILCLKKKPGRMHDMERKLRTLQRRQRNFEYFARIELVNVVNKWVIELCTEPAPHRFAQIFGRRYIVEPLTPESAQREYEFLKKPDKQNRIMPLFDQPKALDPLWIQRLKNLNELRPLYLHEQDLDYLCRPNFENVRRGAEMLLEAFIGLWQEVQGDVFPSVIIVKRIIQTEPQVTRLDYVDERQPNQLCAIRVQSSALPGYVSELLGREAYFSHRDDGEGAAINEIALIPVQEGLSFESITQETNL